MTPYKTLLKQVGDGLCRDDIDSFIFSLGFKDAIKTSIKTGIQLMTVMERQGVISENNLSPLIQLLEEQDLKPLAKDVKQFVQKKNLSKKESQSLEMTSKRKSSVSSLQMDIGPYSSSPSQDPVQPMPSQLAGVYTPSASFPGNQQGNYATFNMPFHGGPRMQQQGYPGHNNWEYQPASPNFGTGMTFSSRPSSQSNGNQQHDKYVTSHAPYYGGPGMQHRRYRDPYNQEYPSSASPNYASLQSNLPATLLSHDFFPHQYADSRQNFSQNNLQSHNFLPQQSTYNQHNFFQNNLQSHDFLPQQSIHHQQNFPQNNCNQVKLAPNKYQQQGSLSALPHNQCNTQQNASDSKKICHKSNNPNIPHHTTSTANPGGLVPQSSEENQSSDEDGQQQFEEAVPDTPVGLLENMTLNDLMRPDNHKPSEPTSKVLVSTKKDHEQDNSQSHNATNQGMQSSQVGPVPNSSLSCPVQPHSAIYSGTHTSTKVQDRKKVDGFEKGGYMLKIITNPPTAEHYETSNGCFVLLPWGAEYKIGIRNNEQHRCAVEVTNDGKEAGFFQLLAEEMMIIERPTIEEKKFCFIKPESALPGSGVSVDNPANGIISATFTPEKRSPYMNDLKRGIAIGCLETNYSDFDSSASLQSGYSELAEGQGIFASEDVQRGFIGGDGPSKDWRNGATALMGHSDQQFVQADNFELDDSGKVLIQLILVGRKC